jgi:flagellar hook assembly protein FlgD
VDHCSYPGAFSLWIYNSAGEHVKTLADSTLTAPLHRSYSWDGTNKEGDPCASGIYIFYLSEPLENKTKKILLVR